MILTVIDRRLNLILINFANYNYFVPWHPYKLPAMIMEAYSREERLYFMAIFRG